MSRKVGLRFAGAAATRVLFLKFFGKEWRGGGAGGAAQGGRGSASDANLQGRGETSGISRATGGLRMTAAHMRRAHERKL